MNRSAVAAVLALMVLAGCSSGDTGESVGGDTLSEYGLPSPVERGFGDGQLSVASRSLEQSTEAERAHHEVEVLTAECMRAHGFDYIVSVSTEAAVPPHEEPWALPPAEFTQTYGYGVTTIMLEREYVDATDRTDPNQDVQDSLGDSARVAYETTLWGTDETAGCHEESYLEVHGDLGVTLDAIGVEFGRLLDDVEVLSERVWNDPRVARIVDEWRDCLASRGHVGFDSLDEPRTSIVESAYDAAVPEEDAGAVADGAGLVIEGDTRFVIAPESFAELRELELDLAAADHECRAGHETTYHEVAAELERDFVETHRDELDRYREYVNSGGSE